MGYKDVTREDIEKFLQKNKRTLTDPEYYFGVDNNQDPEENFTESRLKILACFLSPGKNRAVSNTYNALNWLSHLHLGDKVFVDCCYFPDEPNMEILKSNGIPYIFGNVSHHPVRDYDVMFLSCAVMPEVLNVPHFLEYSGIPLTVQERDKDGTMPLIFLGGAAANEAAIILGPIKRNGVEIGNSLIDIAMYGYGEDIVTAVADRMYKFKEEGFDLHDKPLIKETMINEGYLHDNLFYPQYYKWVYGEDNFTIKEIKKLDPRLPDRVEYHKISDSKFRGFPLKAFNLTGENADSHDIQISSGCSGQSSTCAFSFRKGTLLNTEYGLIPIERLLEIGVPTGSPAENVRRYELPKFKVQAGSGVEESSLVYSVGTKPCKRIRTKYNYHLDVTGDHKCLVYRDGEAVSVETNDIKIGDRMFLSPSNVFSEVGRSLAECEFVGRMVGDGWYNSRARLYASLEEESGILQLMEEAGIKWTSREARARNTVSYNISMADKKKYGLESYDEQGKRIPCEVWHYSREQLLYFIRGLFDADATVSKTGLDITFASSNKRLCTELKQLLLSVGIYTSWRENDNERVDEELKFDSTTHLYRLYVVSNDSKRVLREVGFRNKEKNRRLMEAVYSEDEDKHVRVLGQATPYLKEDYRFFTDEVVGVDDLGIDEIYDITVEPTHTVVANGFVVNQCMEGTVAGNYTERELDDIVEDMKFVRRTAAPNTISWFSFNLNYYKHFMDLLAMSSDYFKGVTLLNERLDVVANAPDQLALAKKLGLKRFSGAIEGMGERVREHILNKNLPKETLFKAVEVVSSLGLMHMKCGLIATGQETEEDIQDFISEIDEMIAIRDRMGANHSYQFNVTPLVFYSQIPLRYLPRITAKNSYLNVRNMQTLIEACQKRDIRIKFNG